MDTLEQPKTGIGSVEETNRLLSEASEQTGVSAPTFSGAITADSLSEDVKPLKVTPPTPSTTASGLSAVASAVGTQTKLAQEQAQKQAEAQASADTSKTDLTSLMEEITGVQGSRTRLENEAGLGEKAQRVTDYTNQLEALERAELNEIRALQNQPGTLSQKAQRQADISRQYAFQKADVALLQSAANRDYETAFNIVNRKIELALEPLKTRLEFTKMFYEDNREDLSKAEDRAFNLRVNEMENEYSDRKALEKYKADITMRAIENGVPIPSYVLGELRDAETMQGVAEVLASNGVDLRNPLDVQEQALRVQELRQKVGEAGGSKSQTIALAQTSANVQLANNLLNTTSFANAVGPNILSRVNIASIITGEKGDVIAGIEQIRSQLSLDALINAKSQGATFGALSDRELNVLSSSATKIGSWAIEDENGNVKGYKTSQKSFREELDKINNFAKLDYLLKGGNPEDVGVTQMEDGSYWTKNSDGSFTQIR